MRRVGPKVFIVFLFLLIPLSFLYAEASGVIVRDSCDGNGLRRFSVYVQSNNGFSSISITLSYDSSIIIPYSNHPGAAQFIGRNFPFQSYYPNFSDWIFAPLECQEEFGYRRVLRAAFSAPFGNDGHTGNEMVRVFSFLYRLRDGKTIYDMDMNSLRIENGAENSIYLAAVGSLAGIILSPGMRNDFSFNYWGHISAGNSINSVEFNYSTHGRLARPQITIDGSVLSWDVVHQAEMYRIYVDQYLAITTASTSICLDDLTFEAGNRSITVVASAPGLINSPPSLAEEFFVFAGPNLELIFRYSSGEFRGGVFHFDCLDGELEIEIINSGDLHVFDLVVNLPGNSFLVDGVGVLSLAANDSYTAVVGPSPDLGYGVFAGRVEVFGLGVDALYVYISVEKIEDENIDDDNDNDDGNDNDNDNDNDDNDNDDDDDEKKYPPIVGPGIDDNEEDDNDDNDEDDEDEEEKEPPVINPPNNLPPQHPPPPPPQHPPYTENTPYITRHTRAPLQLTEHVTPDETEPDIVKEAKITFYMELLMNKMQKAANNRQSWRLFLCVKCISFHYVV